METKNYYQEMQDKMYAQSLGYETEINIQERMEYEMTHLFNYEKKTKEYLESLY